MKLAFTGHRPTKIGGYNRESIQRKRVFTRIEWAISFEQPSLVITGGALGVDMDAAHASIKLGVPFDIYLPHVGHGSHWPQSSQDELTYLMEKAHEVILVSDKLYSPHLMQVRNEAMVDACDLLVAVWDRSPGGTANCVAYADKVHKPIKYLSPH